MLGAHVPIGLLGPAVWPSEAREEVDEDAGEQKKRAVKVASKMFSVSIGDGQSKPRLTRVVNRSLGNRLP